MTNSSPGKRSSVPRGRDAAEQARKQKPQTDEKGSREKVRGKSNVRSKKRGAKPSGGRQIISVSLGCLWIIIGTMLIGLCGGAIFGGRLAISVLQEIGVRDFSGPRQRIDQYESFFTALDEGGYTAEQGKTNILEGKVTYSWFVKPQGGSDRLRFQWEHDLESNLVHPRTNAALCLDVKLGYASAQDAGAYDGFVNRHERYRPDDPLVKGIVENDFSLIPAQDLAGGWDRSNEPATAVSPGVVSPADGIGRRDAERKEQEEAAAAAAEGGVESDPNDATAVGSNDGDAASASDTNN